MKKRFLISALIGVFGELALLLYIAEKQPSLVNWQLLVSSLLIICGILIIFNLISLRRTALKDRQLLFYAIIFNPGFVSIFAGITGLTMKNPQFQYIYFSSGIMMVLGVFIGFGILIAALIKRAKNR